MGRGVSGRIRREGEGQFWRGGKNSGVKIGTPVDRQRGPPTGLGVMALRPTPGAIILGTKSQAGTGERRLGNRGDRKLGTGRVQRNVAKSDTGGARRDRHRKRVTVGKFRIS